MPLCRFFRLAPLLFFHQEATAPPPARQIANIRHIIVIRGHLLDTMAVNDIIIHAAALLMQRRAGLSVHDPADEVLIFELQDEA